MWKSNTHGFKLMNHYIMITKSCKLFYIILILIVFIKTFAIVDSKEQESKIKRKMSMELEEIKYLKST